MENGQRVYFDSNNLSDKVTNPPNTTLLAFFKLCQSDNFSKTLLYSEVPAYYVWNNNNFIRRKRGVPVVGWPGVMKEHALGRVYTVHPNNSECFYLRLLLHEVRGPTSFEALKTVNGVLNPTFQAACKMLGLLEDDHNWHSTLEEAALLQSPAKMRDLFSVMLVFCQISDPLALWEDFKEYLSEDFKRGLQKEIGENVENFKDVILNECLSEIEEAVLTLGGKSIETYGLPKSTNLHHAGNRECIRETNFDPVSLGNFVNDYSKSLTTEQMSVYEEVMKSIEESEGKFFFVDAPGGTGKTYLLNLLLAKVRSTCGIALAVASSGIAATLLQGGRTAHAALKLPLNLTNVETPLCNIQKQSHLAELLKNTKLIVWDEITMAHKRGVEALDRSLQDIRNSKTIMGGMTVLLGGDFRQTLPVVPKGTRADEIKACIKRSFLWPSIKVLKLTRNMRVHLRGDVSAGKFADLLLQIGNGTYPQIDGLIKIPNELCTTVSTVEELIDKIYPDVKNIRNKPMEWLCERAILTPKNDQAAAINEILINSFEDEEIVYNSIDTMVNIDESVNYPVEFLNSLNPPGLPCHRLKLRLGAPIMYTTDSK